MQLFEIAESAKKVEMAKAINSNQVHDYSVGNIIEGKRAINKNRGHRIGPNCMAMEMPLNGKSMLN